MSCSQAVAVQNGNLQQQGMAATSAQKSFWLFFVLVTCIGLQPQVTATMNSSLQA